MKTFNYFKYKDFKWDSDILKLVSGIYRNVGKQEFYLKLRSEELEKLVEIAKIQSTETSNAIEGIRTTKNRLNQLVSGKTTPPTDDEKEILGYYEALKFVHENFDIGHLTPDFILKLHKILYTYLENSNAGKTKSVQNYINATFYEGKVATIFTPLSPSETPQALQSICDEFNIVIGNAELEPLIAIPIFIHDFLCIHPFVDGNGRMSRLLTTLLLYRSGFYVGKYISLESKIAKHKDLYYDALMDSQFGWHEGKENPNPFIKYILGTIISAYKDFEDRFTLVENKLSAIEVVKKATQNLFRKFEKRDIMNLCPSLSISSVESALRKLVEEGELKREGVGKSIRYIRIK